MLRPLCVVGRIELSRFRLQIMPTLTLMRYIQMYSPEYMYMILIVNYDLILQRRSTEHDFLHLSIRCTALTLRYGHVCQLQLALQDQPSLHCRPTKHRFRQCSFRSPYSSVRNAMAAEMERSIVGSLSLMSKMRQDCSNIYVSLASMLLYTNH